VGFAAPEGNTSGVTWGDLAAHIRTYLALAASAVALGCLAGVPLGVLSSHVPAARTPVLALVNLGRVVPSLAVLTFMLPILGVGFVPALAALALLAIPPVAINADLAFRGVPGPAIDAARGMGMTAAQVFARVEWPLAFPLLFTGVRTAATEVIGSAVLAAFIGAGGLGEYVTTGLQANDPRYLWTGVGAIAAIALAAEFALAFAQRRLGKAT
jgi:osmoprotectant transport system permease protein